MTYHGVIEPGTIMEPFVFGPLLLEPTNSEIFMCSSREDNSKYIAKVVRKDYSGLEAETYALCNFESSYIIKLIEIRDVQLANEGEFRIFFLEAGVEGDFLDLILKTEEPFTEEFLARFFYYLALGCQYIHNQGFIHRDIKPENILIFYNEYEKIIPKIIDFAYCTKIPEEGFIFNDRIGTLNYASPELFLKEGYSYPTDVWSYGITLYTAVMRENPFNLQLLNQEEITPDVFNTDEIIEKLQNNNVSESLINLISSLLSFDPSERPTFDNVIYHPWFSEFYPLSEREEEPKLITFPVLSQQIEKNN